MASPDAYTVAKRSETLADFVTLGHRKMSPIKAILAKCNWCSRSQWDRIDCLVKDCPLYPFRLGADPYRAPKSEAQRESARSLTAKRQAQRSLRVSESTPHGQVGTTTPAIMV